MIRPLAVLALTGFAVTASSQDLTITFKSSDGSTAMNYFSKDRMRMNSGRSDSIMEFDSGTMINIDHQKKEYSEITIAELDANMKAMSAKMEESMAKMPPQMREQMAKLMGGATADVTVTKGGTKTIAGYVCQEYTVTMGKNMTQESCNSTALTPPFDPANFQKLTHLSIPMMQGADKLIEKMSVIQGISLMNHTSINMMGNKRDTTMEATEVKKGPIAADVFAVPAGYKKIDSPMKNMGKMGR
ncbi:MAG: DUF4412 domain-containing protein [Vicinamibacteria bacterium]